MTELVQYEPRLQVPIELGRRISAENYGEPARGIANNGDIQFALDARLWSYLAYSWIGRTFRLLLLDSSWNGETVNAGRVSAMTHDTLTATVSTTDASTLLDDVLVSDLYGDDALASIQGQPKPQLWGTAYSIEPILEDDTALIYRISRTALAEVLEVRVGGVAWDYATSSPGPGQWTADLANGTITLGGTTADGEVRCDARAVGWESATASAVLVDIIATSGLDIEINTTVMATFEAAAPYLIGYYASSPINRLDAFDEIMLGVGAWWGFDFDDNLIAGVIQAPESGDTIDLVTTSALQLTQILPPAWRIRVEHTRNWQPGTQFFDSVPEATQAALKATGTVLTALEDQTVKDADPRAFDVPLIRLLVNSDDDAAEIGSRLATAWSVERRLYDITVEIANDGLPDIYSSRTVDYMMVSGDFRAHGVTQAYGGGPAKLTLWG